MPASEQLTEVEIDDLQQTEYKIINLKSDTKYIVYLLAVTIADGESTFVEESTNVLAGLLFGVCHQFYLFVFASAMTLCCLTLDVCLPVLQCKSDVRYTCRTTLKNGFAVTNHCSKNVVLNI